ncbi:MAG: hypothetical protein H0U57_08125 [Tatlockia sp.]|nr:hypothetical protein [Tatlockia sp.]
MKKYVIGSLLFSLTTMAIAQNQLTKRIEQFSNKQVSVWKTIVYPTKNHSLSMHRHEHDRVLVALTNGLLKITNDRGKIHYLHLKKDKAYFLRKDIANEMHNDENMSNYPVKVMVIELN